MYSQNELDEAVAAGAISAEAAASLRAHIERQHSQPTVDEEQFRLLTGFNDIFVAIAAAILLFSVAWIGQRIGAGLGLAIEGEGPSPLGPLALPHVVGLPVLTASADALPSIRCCLPSSRLVRAAAFPRRVAPSTRGNVHCRILRRLGASPPSAAWLHWKTFRARSPSPPRRRRAALAVGVIAALATQPTPAT